MHRREHKRSTPCVFRRENGLTQDLNLHRAFCTSTSLQALCSLVAVSSGCVAPLLHPSAASSLLLFLQQQQLDWRALTTSVCADPPFLKRGPRLSTLRWPSCAEKAVQELLFPTAVCLLCVGGGEAVRAATRGGGGGSG